MSNKSAQDWLLSNNRFFQEMGQPTLEGPINFPRGAKTISITGGKGGIGKSTIALKLGRMFSNMGYKTLLIDCDYNLSNTSVKLGLPLNNNFFELVNGIKSFSECLFKENNFHLLPGCNGSVDLFNNEVPFEKFIINLLMEKEKEYDFIILDCPAGVRKEFLTLNAYSDYRFIVVNPDKSSITDSYSIMKILGQSYGIKENHLVVNKADNTKQAQKLIKAISETVETFLNGRLHILGIIHQEKTETEFFDMFMLNNADSKIHREFLKIIENFTEKTLGVTALEKKRPLIGIPFGPGGKQDVHFNTGQGVT